MKSNKLIKKKFYYKINFANHTIYKTKNGIYKFIYNRKNWIKAFKEVLKYRNVSMLDDLVFIVMGLQDQEYELIEYVLQILYFLMHKGAASEEILEIADIIEKSSCNEEAISELKNKYENVIPDSWELIAKKIGYELIND